MMPRRGINPDRETWNLKVSSVVVRTRMDAIRDAIERDKGRDVTYTEVLEELCAQWERTA
jgi:hypothetical protein